MNLIITIASVAARTVKNVLEQRTMNACHAIRIIYLMMVDACKAAWKINFITKI